MLEMLPARLGRALRHRRSGLARLTYNDAALAHVSEALRIASEEFADCAPIPRVYTADGDGVSPPLSIRLVPFNAQSLVLIVEDADSPTPQPLVHAIAWWTAREMIELQTSALGGSHDVALGRNSFLQRAYLPPDPPRGHGVHRYAFQLFACDKAIDEGELAGRGSLMSLLREHAIAKACVFGTYERP